MICFATFLFELCDDRLYAEEVLSPSAVNPVSVKIEPGWGEKLFTYSFEFDFSFLLSCILETNLTAERRRDVLLANSSNDSFTIKYHTVHKLLKTTKKPQFIVVLHKPKLCPGKTHSLEIRARA